MVQLRGALPDRSPQRLADRGGTSPRRCRPVAGSATPASQPVLAKNDVAPLEPASAVVSPLGQLVQQIALPHQLELDLVGARIVVLPGLGLVLVLLPLGLASPPFVPVAKSQEIAKVNFRSSGTPWRRGRPNRSSRSRGRRCLRRAWPAHPAQCRPAALRTTPRRRQGYPGLDCVRASGIRSLSS